jgi:hypothetical protein
MSFQGRDKKRQSTRRVSLSGIRFSFVDDPRRKARIATTMDISDTGMCLYTLCHLEEGEKIIIQNNDLSLSWKATVRWVKHYGKNFCKAGLMYIQ